MVRFLIPFMLLSVLSHILHPKSRNSSFETGDYSNYFWVVLFELFHLMYVSRSCLAYAFAYMPFPSVSRDFYVNTL